jgi:hypothetical protein
MISGRSPEQSVEALGHHLIIFSLRSGHGRFLKAQGATLPIFLQKLGLFFGVQVGPMLMGQAQHPMVHQVHHDLLN